MRFKTVRAGGLNCVRILGCWLALAIFATGPASADCGRTPGELAANLPLTADPILHMTRLMGAMDECGTGRQFDLMLNRQALAIRDDAMDQEALSGTWMSDMWLPVATGLSTGMIDVLTVDGGNISQSLYLWFDPEQSENPEVFPKYVLDLAAAAINKTPERGLAIGGTRSSDQISLYNRYQPVTGSEPDKLQHAMTSFMTIDLGNIVTIRVEGDHLLLVDKSDAVRTYSRIAPDVLKGGHAFIFVAQISALRHWSCVSGVLRGVRGNKRDRERFLAASRTALKAFRLKEEIWAQQRLVKQAKSTNADSQHLELTLKAKQEAMTALANAPKILTVVDMLVGESRPNSCPSK